MRRSLIFVLLIGVLGTATLVSLGVWQWGRMHWKEAILADLSARIAASPVPLPPNPDPAADKYRPVTLTGRFTGDEAFLLMGVKGGLPGVEVISAFATDDGRRILVERGFLPDENRAAPRPASAAPVTLTGNLHWPQDADAYTPPPDPKTGLWFARDVPALAAKLGTLPVLVVAASPTGDGITPSPVSPATLPNNHFAYAVQWFLMAAVWAGMTLFWLLGRKRAA